MPILFDDYNPSFLFKNKHFSTIYPSLFRKFPTPSYKRTRIETKDGDFFDIDSLYSGKNKAILIGHGLEGHSKSAYVVGMSKLLQEVLDCDIHVFNFRTCSGEMNRLPSAYNAAITEDLDQAIQWLLPQYEQIALVGFSLSANLILNYLGQNKSCLSPIPSQLKAAVAISAPIEMISNSQYLARKSNFIYEKRFLMKLKRKIAKKLQQFPDIMSLQEFKNIKTLKQFDNAYTSKMLGKNNAEEYYAYASSLQYLSKITIPTLILSALNDPFLSPACFPVQECEKNKILFLLQTKFGGHVGFYQKNNCYYDEEKAADFIKKYFI